MPVEMAEISKHELSPVPLSLAKLGGEMNTTQKADLIHILSSGITIPAKVSASDKKTCVIIDGHTYPSSWKALWM